MNLFISLLVLVLSLCSLNPILLAYRLPNRSQKSSSTNTDSLLLTANSETFPSYTLDSSNLSGVIAEKISYLSEVMSKQKLYGIWQSLNNAQEENFGGQEGFSSLSYVSDTKSYEESFDFMLCFYNGLYTNTNYSCVTYSEFIPLIQEMAFNEKNGTLNFNDITIHLSEGKTDSINQLGRECVANSTIYFLDKTDNSIFVPSYDIETDMNNLAVQISIQSTDCSLNLITDSMNSEDTLNETQAMDYSVVMTVAAVFQGILCFFLDKILQQKKNLCQRISLGTLRIINAFDFYLAVESFFQLNNNVIVGFMALPYAILSFYCETKIIRTVAVAQGNLAERGFHSLHVMNGICLIASMVVAATSAFIRKPELMFFLFCLHQIPQIMQNYKMQRKFTKTEAILFLFILPKLAYITYVLTFPRNLFRYLPDIDVAVVLANIFLFQALVLFVQRKYPTFWIKSKIVYQTFALSEGKHKEEVCCICLENPESTTDGSDNSLLKHHDKENKTMILTPCQHQFHECCLRDWIKLKCVCPYCRNTLPLLPEDD